MGRQMSQKRSQNRARNRSAKRKRARKVAQNLHQKTIEAKTRRSENINDSVDQKLKARQAEQEPRPAPSFRILCGQNVGKLEIRSSTRASWNL